MVADCHDVKEGQRETERDREHMSSVTFYLALANSLFSFNADKGLTNQLSTNENHEVGCTVRPHNKDWIP